jgi:hypothetical protein
MAFVSMKNQSRRKISVTSAWTFHSLTSIKTYEVQGDYLISSCISFRNTYLTINFPPHTPWGIKTKIRTKTKIQKWQRKMEEITVSPMTSRKYMYRTLTVTRFSLISNLRSVKHFIQREGKEINIGRSLPLEEGRSQCVGYIIWDIWELLYPYFWFYVPHFSYISTEKWFL